MIKTIFKIVKHLGHKMIFRHIDKCVLCLSRITKRNDKLLNKKNKK